VYVNAKASLLRQVQALDCVLRVRPETTYPLVAPLVDSVSSAEETEPGHNWHLAAVRAPAAWAYARGANVTVAVIDGGALATHVAIAAAYRGYRAAPADGSQHDYAWIDYVAGHPEPRDVLGGLGTQMLSVAVGQQPLEALQAGADPPGPLGVGIAPAARWMAAATCDATWTCAEQHVVQGVQFALCPTRRDGTKPDCARGADVLLASWGGVAADVTLRHIFFVLSQAGPWTLPRMGGPRADLQAHLFSFSLFAHRNHPGAAGGQSGPQLSDGAHPGESDEDNGRKRDGARWQRGRLFEPRARSGGLGPAAGDAVPAREARLGRAG
jgi:hypothetical protein